jgi:hypothetical protein
MHIDDDSEKEDDCYSKDSLDVEDQYDIESVVDTNRYKGTNRRKQRRHYFPYTVAQKIDLVKIANRSNNILQTAIYFGVDPNSIRNWKNNMHRIREKVLVNPNASTFSTGPLPEYPDLESNLN